MLSYEEALERLLAATVPLPAVDAALAHAAGRVLAADVRALLTQPPFAASAMDGYAVRFDDRPGPWQIVGESAAGRRFSGIVGAGEAVRIFTGAPLPAGCDTIVLQEDVRASDGELRLSGSGPPSLATHIRPAGKDFAAGDLIVAAGARLSPAHVGLVAAAGHSTVSVHRRPRVALIATGNELVAPGRMPAEDQIVSSNGIMLAALFGAAGCDVADLGIVPDDIGVISDAVSGAECDLLVTIGGASVGDHDHVQAALSAAGASVDFWKVAIKPGKPMIAGSLGDALVLGLPGNPVSAFVCAVLFALPMLRRMAGIEPAVAAPTTAMLLTEVAANGGRRDHLRARLTEEGVTPFDVQDSSMLGTLARANALVIRPVDAPAAKAGDAVPVLPLDMLHSAP